MKPVRVLVVDDSATIRHLLSAILTRDPQIEVVGAAPDAATARQMIKDLNPDVITLDVEMPNMNGIDFLEKIMRLRPMPVVMVSTLTEQGAEVTLDALAIGAVDFFPKPTQNVGVSLDAAAGELTAKVKAAALAKLKPYSPRPAASAPECDERPCMDHVIAIGSSTGGVEALLEVLSHFPANCPPTVITQHMPAGFTSSFAKRLDRMCRPAVAEAREGAILTAGKVWLAPGAVAHLEVAGRGTYRCHLAADAAMSGHRPSVDRQFLSVSKSVGQKAIGVLLTGMGRDGAIGLKAMRDAGAATIGQDEATSVVYGMPRAAQELGAVARQLPLEKIGPEIVRLSRQPVSENV
ncbi:MAG: chemotaxis response regulator protein-glutamate methylesterase [Proteobacteria bacterium]|nr:chemotaxis response regulator protein-glutamate methylesterase [Pseudomonadota bacterium]